MAKTVKVTEIIELVNRRLNMDFPQPYKAALACMLCDVLHSTGNYMGFTYNFDWSAATEEERKAQEFNRTYLTAHKLK